MRWFSLYRLKRSARPAWWLGVAACVLLFVVALGSALQGRSSESLLAMPFVWFFSLVLLPLALFVIVRQAAKHIERTRR
ncbi:MAG: hypothetical protein M9908_11655 [Phyllobacteriaceae bacterium]|nr:hypothetical protein [Nitratireductor sp.]MCO5134973.1 hypothetical protein [Phyllobacteriaceae bacterium]